MQIHVTSGNIAQQATDCIVVNLFEGVAHPGGATGAVDNALSGAISRLIASGDFSGEANTTALLYTDGKIAAPRVLVVGLGQSDKFELHGVRKAAAVTVNALAKLKGVKNFATIVHGAGIAGLDTTAAAQALAEGTLSDADYAALKAMAREMEIPSDTVARMFEVAHIYSEFQRPP